MSLPRAAQGDYSESEYAAPMELEVCCWLTLHGHCDGPALRWPSRTSQRDVPTFKSGLDPHSALESFHPREDFVRDGFYGGFGVGIEAHGGLGGGFRLAGDAGTPVVAVA